MAINIEAYQNINSALKAQNVQLVAVSKLKPTSDILEMYNLGQKDFGENYVQELVEKQPLLPEDIRWHFIGHLQSNKVKYIAPFVHLIHGVDSLKLLKEISKQAKKANRHIDCLLQIHIASEETKFGLDENELYFLMSQPALPNVRVRGLMGMASFTENQIQVAKEFAYLQSLYQQYPSFDILSMGMSGDYRLAMEHGSNMVRIGSLLFGRRG